MHKLCQELFIQDKIFSEKQWEKWVIKIDGRFPSYEFKLQG